MMVIRFRSLAPVLARTGPWRGDQAVAGPERPGRRSPVAFVVFTPRSTPTARSR